MDGGHREEHLEGATLVVTSPGVAQSAPILRWAAEQGVPVWSEIELGARLCRVPYVAVTGTNGKTTTTQMLASIMRAAGMDAIACGNVGHPFVLAAREHRDALAVEASSFQLRFTESLHPRVSVLLNIAEDHLDWHGSLEAYAGAKAAIYRNQAGDDTHVGNRDDPSAAKISGSAPCTQAWFTKGAPSDDEVGCIDDRLVGRLDETTIELGSVAANGGLRADAAAAARASLAFGIDPAAISGGLASAPSLPHRGTQVAVVDGVRFVDDSKATNPHAALAALEGVRDAVLIAGGRSKGVDLSPLADAASRLSGVVAIGEAAPEIVRLFESRVPTRTAGSIEEAVDAALDLAPPNGVVVLAPACASQDMFRDYRERGDRFGAAASKLAKEGVLRG